MIKKFDEFVEESLWMDSIKRANSNEVRKEDDINIMDIYDFTDYLDSKYKVINRDNQYMQNIYSKGFYIVIPITISRSMYVQYKSHNDIDYIQFNNFKKGIPLLYDYVKERFNLTEQKKYLYIESKNNELKNSVVVEIIEKILNVGLHTPCIKKRT